MTKDLTMIIISINYYWKIYNSDFNSIQRWWAQWSEQHIVTRQWV